MKISQLKQLLDFTWDPEKAKVYYLEFGSNSLIKECLVKEGAERWNTWLFEQLSKEYELIKIEEAKPKLKPLPSVISKLENTQLANEIAARKRLFAEATELHEKLEKLETMERQKACFTILENWDKIAEYWKRFNYFGRNGDFPPIFKDIQIDITMDKGDLRQQLLNARTNITKTNNKITNHPNSARIEDWKEKVTNWNDLVHKIENILN